MLTISALSKTYSGGVRALDSVTLDVPTVAPAVEPGVQEARR